MRALLVRLVHLDLQLLTRSLSNGINIKAAANPELMTGYSLELVTPHADDDFTDNWRGAAETWNRGSGIKIPFV